MPENLEFIREYIKERDTYSFAERQLLRENLRKGIKKVKASYIPFVDIVSGSTEN